MKISVTCDTCRSGDGHDEAGELFYGEDLSVVDLQAIVAAHRLKYHHDDIRIERRAPAMRRSGIEDAALEGDEE